MKIYQYPLGQLQANCYIVVHNSDCLVIDPGDSAEFILEEIQRKKLRPVALLATHGHFDHIMASGEIQLSFPIPLYISSKDQFLVDRVESTAKHFLGFVPSYIQPILVKDLHQGSIHLGAFSFEVVATPGHTPGSVSFYFKKEKAIFTGDTLFQNGIGEYRHSYGNIQELKRSVAKLLMLPQESRVYPGHGEETLIQTEKKHYE